MERKPSGFDLEIIPAWTLSGFVDTEIMSAEMHRTQFREGPNERLKGSDYDDNSQGYLTFFRAKLNYLSIQDGGIGRKFLDYQQKQHFHEAETDFYSLLYAVEQDKRYLYREALECVEDYLSENDITKRHLHTSNSLSEKFFLLKNALKLAAHFGGKNDTSNVAVSETNKDLKLIDCGFTEVQIVRLLLFILDNKYYYKSKTEIQNKTALGRHVFEGRGKKRTAEEEDKLVEILKSWISEKKGEPLKNTDK